MFLSENRFAHYHSGAKQDSSRAGFLVRVCTVEDVEEGKWGIGKRRRGNKLSTGIA